MNGFLRTLIAITIITSIAPVSAADTWQYPVYDIQPFRVNATTQVPMPEETPFVSSAPGSFDKYKMCLLMPQTVDSIFVAYIYAAIDEAEKMGQAITVMDAGGYDKDTNQRAQFENCLTTGADAILLEPISPDGWNADIASARKQGVKVINVTEPLNANVDGRVVVNFHINGRLLGEKLKQLHPEGTDPVEVVVLPGAAGIPFVENTVAGFREGLEGSSVKVTDVIYGGMDANSQLKLVEDLVVTRPNLDYLVGNAMAIDQAVNVLARRGMVGEIGLMSTYLTPTLLEHLKKNRVIASSAESSTYLKRIAIHLALRALEGEDEKQDLVPHVQLVTPENAGDPAITEANFQPKGWKPRFNVE